MLEPNYWFRIIRSPVSALRAGSSEVVLLWRHKKDPWSGCVPLYPPIGVFWNRPNDYSNSSPFTVGLGIQWFTTFDFRSNFDMLQGCYSKGKPIQSMPTKSVESYWAYQQVEPRSAADARADKILQDTAYHDGWRYPVTMIWADGQISLPNNYFSALVQLKSLERRLGKYPNLKEQCSTTVRYDLSKGYIVEVDLFWDRPTPWVVLTTPPRNSPAPVRKVQRVLKGTPEIHDHSLNNALLTGSHFLQTLMHVLLSFR